MSLQETLREPKIHFVGYRASEGMDAYIAVAELGERDEKGYLRACGKIYRRDFLLHPDARIDEKCEAFAAALFEIAAAAREDRRSFEGDAFGEPAKYQFVPPLKDKSWHEKLAGTLKLSALFGGRSVRRVGGTGQTAKR